MTPSATRTQQKSRPRRAVNAHRRYSSTFRLLTSTAVGVVVGVAVAVPAPWKLGLLVGWLAGATLNNAWLWLTVRDLDADETAELAVREDPGRAVLDVAVLCAAVASLVAVAVVVNSASNEKGGMKAALVTCSVLSVFAAWFLVHLSFMTRYARMYYSGTAEGISFNEDDDPRYVEFAYFSFTIGMTFQVSDTNIGDKGIRAVALRHGVLAWLFGAVILASMINVLAGLSK